MLRDDVLRDRGDAPDCLVGKIQCRLLFGPEAGIEGALAPINGEALVQESAATLILWILAGFGLAMAYFARQDLSKE